MYEINNIKFNPDILYSFFPKNKRLKLSKQGIHFISNTNMINNLQSKNILNMNEQSATNNRGINPLKNFKSTNYKWNNNYDSNPNSNSNINTQKINGFASSTGTNFYKGKNIQSSYGRKFRVNNGYQFKGNSQKKNIKINSKNNLIENKNSERVQSVKVSDSLEDKSGLNNNNRLIERFFNQYETNVKKVLFEMGVVGNIKDKIITPLSRSNNNNIKSYNTKSLTRVKSDKNNLPILNNQNLQDNKITLHKTNKIYGFSNFNPSSERNIININNYINFYSHGNHMTYNSNSHNNIMKYNNNHFNNIYGTLTNTTLNNNLATNSTNSNIGNNNIIFGTSNISKRNSIYNFSNNIKAKSRSINSINSNIKKDLKKLNSEEMNSPGLSDNNILSDETRIKNQNIDKNNNNNNKETNKKPIINLNQKKSRAASTAPHQCKINIIGKDNQNTKKDTNKNINNNNIIINNINNVNNYTSKYNSAATQQKQIQNKNDKLAKYEIGHTLGKGAYAKVKQVTNTITQEDYAMKIYDKDKLNDNSKKKCIYREIEILKRVNHKNIAKLVEVINTQNHILIVQELVTGISLRDYYNREIRNQKGISEHKAKIFKKIFKQIFEAMNYLHKNYIAHRDIKLENILMTREYEIKIIDFGFGMYNPENQLQNFFCGTPNYMPPEIAFKKPYVGQKADLWSLGVLIYKLYCADFPFKGKNEKELYKSIKRGRFTFASYTPDYIRRIIVKMIDLDPNKRLTCENVLSSSWLRD